MTVTALGFLFIPVTLVCLFVWPSYLFPVLVVASIFQGGSVANRTGGDFAFGIPPFFFVAFCIAVRYLVPILRNGQRVLLAEGPIRKIVITLFWFWALAVVSAFILPRLFSGIAVYSPREGLESQLLEQASLTWSLSNLAQALFLSLCFASVLAALFALRTERQARPMIRALYIAFLVVVFVGLWQSVSTKMRWDFPASVFNNNVGFNQGYDQILEDYDRVSSTFSEPSYAGAFLGAIAAGLLAGYLRGRRTALQLALFLTVCLVLLETTASAGYATFAATVGLVFLYFNPFIGQQHVRRFLARGWSAVAGVACVGAIFFITPKLSQAAAASSVNKVQSLSFMFRIAADLQALSVVRNTFGLGAGLGSNRPSSLLTSLLSNVGVVGTLLLAAAIYLVFKMFPGKKAPPSMQFAFFSLVGLLIGQMTALPEITLPMTWALFMIVLVQLSVAFTADAATANAGLPPIPGRQVET